MKFKLAVPVEPLHSINLKAFFFPYACKDLEKTFTIIRFVTEIIKNIIPECSTGFY